MGVKKKRVLHRQQINEMCVVHRAQLVHQVMNTEHELNVFVVSEFNPIKFYRCRKLKVTWSPTTNKRCVSGGGGEAGGGGGSSAISNDLVRSFNRSLLGSRIPVRERVWPRTGTVRWKRSRRMKKWH